MSFLRVLPVLALVVATSACGDGDDATGGSTAGSAEVLALVSRGTTSRLRRMDAVSLQPRGNGVAVGMHDLPWAASPDGRRLALGSGRRASLQLVSTRPLRSLGVVALEGMAVAVTWPRPRVVLVVRRYRLDQLDAVFIDTAERRIERSELIARGAAVLAAARVPDGVALLLGGERSIVPVELVVVRADGDVSRARLDQIDGGFVARDVADDGVARYANPALTVSPNGRHAAVVARGGRIALVELDSMAASYPPTSRPASLLGRLRSWLDPEARAGGGGGPSVGTVRVARWLPGGILVSGADSVSGRGGAVRSTRVGLELVDPATWSVRTLAQEPTSFSSAWPFVIATDERGTSTIFEGGADGTFARVAGLRRTGSITIAGSRVYLGLADQYRPHDVAIVDAADGRTLGRARAPGWVSILDPARPHVCWCSFEP